MTIHKGGHKVEYINLQRGGVAAAMAVRFIDCAVNFVLALQPTLDI